MKPYTTRMNTFLVHWISSISSINWGSISSMTNNSSKGVITYVEKLSKLGVEATEEQISSSVNSKVLYLNQLKPGDMIFLIGTESLNTELLNEGIDVIHVDYRETDVDCV